MFVICDSREKVAARQKIIDYFQQNNIEYDISKLYIGDYIDYSNHKYTPARSSCIISAFSASVASISNLASSNTVKPDILYISAMATVPPMAAVSPVNTS